MSIAACSSCSETFSDAVRIAGHCRKLPMKVVQAAYARRPRSAAPSGFLIASASIIVASMVAIAAVNRYLAKRAEAKNPPKGRFVEANGVRLHYMERGDGDPIVLLHGNGSVVQDFECSGLFDIAARQYRVVAFDRPGFGHSRRPRSVVWTPDAQAKLLKLALEKIGVSTAIVLGHSWGAPVAVAMAHQYPAFVRGLVLASGYYYPSVRSDTFISLPASLPLVGDILSHTLSPLVERLAWPMMMAKMFGPRLVPAKFNGFPKEMALRPSQLRAAAAEATLMVPDALRERGYYGDLKMPVAIIAGAQDKLVDTEAQSARLHSDIPHSSFHRIAGNGHMIHQTATEEVMSALRESYERVDGRRVVADRDFLQCGLALE
ncbi:alpha/beta fold hydrolase [Bradyrhizobium sp. Arg816]|uniref:alpha/beta fold hydrolase n=1 Tax=Bradyrhizobium sp. Arg816 TaxID=2998491 RepID=UPI00249EFAAF|nr:alpha/beta hydrolase [Bradyrhizobium sp. Arg816]MDI3562391.1 alpha/beta hydrolase [Bradyrhizobium sp. Arg816]